MFDLNEYQGMMRLTYDPSSKTVGSVQIAELRLASDRRWKDKNGEQKKKTLFLDATVWDQKQVEWILKTLHKGDGVFVKGELELDQWDDKTSGEKRSKIKLRAFTVKKDWQKGESAEATPDAGSPGAGSPGVPSAAEPEDEEEIPF